MLKKPLLSLFLSALVTTLEAAPAFYAGAGVGYGDIRLSHTHFNSSSGQFHAGAWIIDNVGIELRINAELNDDTERGITTSIPRIATAALRFQSPEDLGLKVYVLAGAGRVTLDSHADGGNTPGRDDFDAGLIALGLLAPLSADRRLGIYLEASRYFLDRDNDAPLAVGSLGVQYDF